MNVLIVHAHENPVSFCASLADQTRDTFISSGHHAVVSDLYAQEFNPVGGKHDFKAISDASYYKYAMEQLHASKVNGFSQELDTEIEKLLQADVLNFNFPLWWFGMPAILKGWVDRVLAYGVAYGGEYGMYGKGRFKGKRAFISVTTGSPKDAYHEDGNNRKTIAEMLSIIHEGIFELTGFTVLDPFVAYGVSRISEEDRKVIKEDYGSFLKSIIQSS